MKAAKYLSLSAIGIALLSAGGVRADDLPPASDPVQTRERVRDMSSEERTARGEQTRERVRNMTPEERGLMRDTRSDRGGGTRQYGREGGGYGQGYESRQAGVQARGVGRAGRR